MCLQFQHDGYAAVRLSYSKLITPTVSCSFVFVGILAVVEFATRSAARDFITTPVLHFGSSVVLSMGTVGMPVNQFLQYTW